MSDESEASNSCPRPKFPKAAPSMRVPVNAGNRAFLRWLRAAEMSAWEAGRLWGSGAVESNKKQSEARNLLP